MKPFGKGKAGIIKHKKRKKIGKSGKAVANIELVGVFKISYAKICFYQCYLNIVIINRYIVKRTF